jgi:hypothetical protein
MSAKHFLFFSYECPNSKKLLGSLKDTQYQNSFIYIDVQNTRRLPSTLKGVPAILPSMQPETSILHGKHAFAWVQSLVGDQHRAGPKIRGHPNTHGPQNPRSHVNDPGHSVVDPGGVDAKTADKDYLGNSPFEMGGRGYSDKYSFIDNDAGMSHRYSYVNGHEGPGEIGKSVTHEPGEALKDAKGVSQKTKQLNMDLKRLQEERDTFGRPPQRI